MNDPYVPRLSAKFQVSTLSRFEGIMFLTLVAEFVILHGKNIETSDAKRRGSSKSRAV